MFWHIYLVLKSHLQRAKSESESCSVVSDSLQPHGILQARILEWVAVPFSRGSSQPRDRTQVSHIAGGFFTNWATREAQKDALLPHRGIQPRSPTWQAEILTMILKRRVQPPGLPNLFSATHQNTNPGNLAPELIFTYGTLIVFHSLPRGSCSAHLHYVWDL